HQSALVWHAGGVIRDLKLPTLIDGVLDQLPQGKPGFSPGVGTGVGGDVSVEDSRIAVLSRPAGELDQVMVGIADSRWNGHAGQICTCHADSQAGTQAVEQGQSELHAGALMADLTIVSALAG